MRNDKDSDPESSLESIAVNWMKGHTLNDLKQMATEMDCNGNNSEELRQLIDDLQRMGER